MTEPIGRFSATSTIGRGLEEAPVLRQGLGLTWLLAAAGAGGRVVVPIVVQQAIDRGIVGQDEVRLDFVIWCALIGVAAQIVAASASGRRSSGSVCAASRRSTTCAPA
jgi:ATP-binding cassette, subfamily B, bacterial